MSRVSNPTTTAEFVNIAAYKFVDLDRLAERKNILLPLCQSLQLKGTILLADEGINMFLAGSREAVDSFIAHLRSQAEFADLPIKESISQHQPFTRMLVRLKKEIISMGVASIRPLKTTSPKISATQLKQWLDEGKELTLLDVRNDYEVEIGTFANAVPLPIGHFREFPNAAQALAPELKAKPVVMFCTGGIRCEKAGPLMEQHGFQEVYQLDGGILKYFEDCGGEYYDGDCFVFDKRVAVDPELSETSFEQCFNCRAVLSTELQQSVEYDPPNTCPKCFQPQIERRAAMLEQRNSLLTALTTPLPGSIAYDNVRPMNVPLRFDQKLLIEFLCSMHAHLDEAFWRRECELGRVTYKNAPVCVEQIVRSGWRVEHHVPQTTEPDVSNQVKFLYEDEDLIALDKPAPLPMHASGRFNRNTLSYFVKLVFSGQQTRIVHRLDANTTGVVLMAKNKAAAQFIHSQFINGTIKKTYLAKISGTPAQDSFSCDALISAEASTAGSRTIAVSGEDALAAMTEFKVLERCDDGTTLVECRPLTGRTHQIRVHLSHLGFPVVGDPTYNSVDGTIKQSLSVDAAKMCLHAWKLEFQHPASFETVEIAASRPAWSLSE
jgi:UPF0176 protein